ncbi:hypothetical protein AAFC00_005544 [Neodothiora populina]|uniref:SSD domain-containing protein n=1 Tax=Neodothiora populina TaxID=2781224 RepID=A0ABR3PL70_9PEZI
MLWYLLYPIRGTTDPPRLPTENPIRRAFYRHGLLTARHWLLAMLISVGIAVILTYPTVFLSDFPVAGSDSLPHHVWASHRPYGGSLPKTPDMEMRQVWIYGDYMKALDKTVLKTALTLQSDILRETPGPNGEASLRPFGVDWGWVSPLMYWNNSMELLENDEDVVQTINSQNRQPSFFNFSLRPLSVFAGKDFSGAKLTAADALVISFHNRINDPMAEAWHSSLVQFANQASELSSYYHVGGDIDKSRLFEYRFQPLSFRQNFALAIAYGIIAVYVTISLRRLKAFHSRTGLVVTALTQITTSVVASFTICGLLGINLAQIPREAYPFVVLVIGLENIFRFINAVLAYPPEMMNTQRIANGLGDIGMASVASAVQNLVILWIMSMLVSPGVAAFCVFAAVALLFDYFFLFTFFLAVLSVDIRRLELQDSLRLNRSGRSRSRKRKPKPNAERHSWVDALIQGRVPFSTRMAGSVVTISFVLVLNWHFTDHNNPTSSFRAFPGLFEKQGLPTTAFDTSPPNPSDQSRQPGHWLRTQDYESAVHFMDVISPGAVGFIARIYDPLIVTLAGSDRSGIPRDRTWLAALRMIALKHFYPVAMAAVFVVAFVTVLMNFLLWDERAEGAESDGGNSDGQPLTVEMIQTPHQLDVIKLTGCRQGHIVSIGIDRSVSVALYDYKVNSYQTLLLDEQYSSLIEWPVHQCVIDGPSEWMALICDDGQVLIGPIASRRISHQFQLKSKEKILAYRFISSHPSAKDKERGAILVSMHADGSVSECNTRESTCENTRLFEDDIYAARISIADNSVPELIVLDSKARVVSYRRFPEGWRQYMTRVTDVSIKTANNTSLVTASGVEASFLCAQDQLTMLNADNADHLLLPNLPNPFAKPTSLEILHSGRGKCGTCMSSTVDALSFAYNAVGTKECIIQTLAPPEEDGRPLHTSTLSKLCDCVSLKRADRSIHELKSPGSWGATSEVVLGIRQRADTAPAQPTASTQQYVLRRRRRSTTASQSSNDDSEQWEAYMFTSSGEKHTVPIESNSSSENHLYATQAGPAHKVGARAVAIALGNTIYVLRDKSEGPDSMARRISESGTHSFSSRRRLTGRKGQ